MRQAELLHIYAPRPDFFPVRSSDITPKGIVWNVRLKERHGIENLTLPDGNVVSLVCEKYDPARKGSSVRITSQRPVNVKVNEL